MYAMLVRFTRRISTKRPGPYVQQTHWQVHGGGEQAVTSAKALVLEQPGLVCKHSSDLEQVV